MAQGEDSGSTPEWAPGGDRQGGAVPAVDREGGNPPAGEPPPNDPRSDEPPPDEQPPGWDPRIITAAFSALRRGGPQMLSLMIEQRAGAVRLNLAENNLHPGYAVDTRTGEVLPVPDEGPPLDRGPVIFSARLALAALEDRAGFVEVEGRLRALQILLQTAANAGYRIELASPLWPQLDLSLRAMRARQEDLPNLPQAAVLPPPPGRRRRRADGRGVLIGVVDRGCDLAHPGFRNPDGSSRLLFLWDQNDAPPGGAGPLPVPAVPPPAPPPPPYGREFGRPMLDAALRWPDPYFALAYTPESNPYVPPEAGGDQPVHGTHVLGVAAGRGGPGIGVPGVAPGADLAFVHLRRPAGLAPAGGGVAPAAAAGGDVFDGVAQIFLRAGNRPTVVNLSLGYFHGPVDGRSVLELGLDALLVAPRRVITVSAGNGRTAKRHASGAVALGVARRLNWEFGPGDATDNSLGIFYEAPGLAPLLTCTVIGPDGGPLLAVAGPLPQTFTLLRNGQVVGLLINDSAARPGGRLHQIQVVLAPSGAAETFQLELRTAAANEVWFDAWIERDDREPGAQSAFAAAHADPACTLGSIASGRRTIVVGAYDHLIPGDPAADFSAEGPTRDGREKPDLAAPGLGVRAAAARGGRLAAPGAPAIRPLQVLMSGTSVAAPHVAGLAALVLELLPDLNWDGVLQRIRTQPHPPPPVGEWHPQLGDGRADAAETLRNALP